MALSRMILMMLLMCRILMTMILRYSFAQNNDDVKDNDDDNNSRGEREMDAIPHLLVADTCR